MLLTPVTATATVTVVETEESSVGLRHLPAGTARTVDLGTPAHDVAVHWRGSPGAEVTVRLGHPGGPLGAAVDAGRDEVGEHRGDGRTYGALIPAGGATTAVVTSDRPLRSVTVLGFSDGERVTRTVRGAAAHAAVAQPAVVARAGWGADESLRYTSSGSLVTPPTFHPTKRLVVHHTAGANGDTDPAATIRSIYRYHAVTQGWGDIGYNFLVDESGRVYEGRWSREYPSGTSPSGDDARGYGVTGAHTGGWNSGTVGVALLGTLTERDATPAARSALVDFLAWESEKNGLDPAATGVFVNPVSGASKTVPVIASHRDYSATECPGGVFHATLPSLRTAVATRMSGGGTTPPPPPPDTTAPSVPTGLTAVAGTKSVSVSWSASTDDTGVTGYLVQRSTQSATSGFTQVATPTGTSYTSTGLRSGRRYWFRVAARDAAANRSTWSTAVTATAR